MAPGKHFMRNICLLDFIYIKHDRRYWRMISPWTRKDDHFIDNETFSQGKCYVSSRDFAGKEN